MDLFDVLASWGRWLFDAFGVNALLKKIAELFTDKENDDTRSGPNSLKSPDVSRSWQI